MFSRLRAALAARLASLHGPRARRAPGWPEVEVRDDALYVARYPYRHATFHPGGVTIPAARITALYRGWEPVVVVDGRELLFLPRETKEALHAFVARHGIPAPEIVPPWSRLAEPFIDQPYEAEQAVRDERTLAGLGFDAAEVRRIRRRIEWTMLASTFYTLEWGAYSAHDVLRAHAVLAPFRFTREFYWWVMEIALRPYRSTPGARK